jgi:(1->4)-alpha-D-glucan 1-alpha-D-glucosylmutase
MLGAWQPDDPHFLERMQAYALKASREGKQETSWLNPHEVYEAGVKTFLERILDRSRSADFLNALEALARRLSLLGALNSLSQLTLKATLPGVPDFYQGTEFWDFSLVDPDNRRPVDFTARTSALAVLEEPDWAQLVQQWPDGRLKLAWTRHLLRLRSEFPDVFTQGNYLPLETSGAHRDHIIAFARQWERDAVIVAVAKSFAPFTEVGRVWPKAEAFDGAVTIKGYVTDAGENELQLSTLFTHMPVAVLKAKVAVVAKPARKRVRA